MFSFKGQRGSEHPLLRIMYQLKFDALNIVDSEAPFKEIIKLNHLRKV